MNIAKIVRSSWTNSSNSLGLRNRNFDDFIELHGDRSFRDDAIIGGIGWLGDQAGLLLESKKGKVYKIILTVVNLILKVTEALRWWSKQKKFGRPVVTFINTAGAYPGVDEERGQRWSYS